MREGAGWGVGWGGVGGGDKVSYNPFCVSDIRSRWEKMRGGGR